MGGTTTNHIGMDSTIETISPNESEHYESGNDYSEKAVIRKSGETTSNHFGMNSPIETISSNEPEHDENDNDYPEKAATRWVVEQHRITSEWTAPLKQSLQHH